ncbi:hypothetical protein [Flavobacterium sp. MMS24-S5]|uniref:hypothetical protein n=1 Tax=Flavobacterium sp. MMS24-S5 TaxID=3416605 RepID=UPI003D085658
MRKIIVLSMISLDGVMQAPGEPEEDTSGGFKFGGWTIPYGDEAYDKAVQNELQPADYLLGRKTFEIWENYQPTIPNFGQELIMEINMFSLKPDKNQIGKIPFLLKVLMLSKN